MYLKRLIIILIAVVSVAYAAGYMLDRVYKKRWSTLFFEKSDALLKSKLNYDVIFLGNSRVHFGINPWYVDSITNLNSYNFGTGGADAEDILLSTRLYLQNHPAPKLAIISLDMGALTINETLRTRFHYLYYLENDSLSKYMQGAGFRTSLVKILPFTKYAFFDEYNRTSLFVKGTSFPIFDHNIYKGFLNIHQHTNSQATDIYNSRMAADSLWPPAIAYFRNTVIAFQERGTEVVFVSPPEKISSTRRNTDFRKITEIIFSRLSSEYHLKRLHFENDPRFTDEYFVDEIHLNEPGTRIYSVQLADSIRNILN